MAERGQLARPMVRRGTGFHPKQARLNRLKIGKNLAAPQPAADNNSASNGNAVNLEPGLGEIETNCANLHVGGSFHVVFTDDHYGTSMPGAGAVHLIKTSANQTAFPG